MWVPFPRWTRGPGRHGPLAFSPHRRDAHPAGVFLTAPTTVSSAAIPPLFHIANPVHRSHRSARLYPAGHPRRWRCPSSPSSTHHCPRVAPHPFPLRLLPHFAFSVLSLWLYVGGHGGRIYRRCSAFSLRWRLHACDRRVISSPRLSSVIYHPPCADMDAGDDHASPAAVSLAEDDGADVAAVVQAHINVLTSLRRRARANRIARPRRYCGSSVGRRGKKRRDFAAGLQRILRDYFGVGGEAPIYDKRDFETRFRVPSDVFRRVYLASRTSPFSSNASTRRVGFKPIICRKCWRHFASLPTARRPIEPTSTCAFPGPSSRSRPSC